MVELVTHGAAALAFLGLTLLLVGRGRIRGTGLAFLGCLVATIAWAGLTAWGAVTGTLGQPPIDAAVAALDVVRTGAWLGFLGVLLWPALTRGARTALIAGLGGLVALNLLATAVDHGWAFDLDDAFGLATRLAVPVAGLLLIENLVRNGSRDGVWSGKFLFVALGAMWAYDLFVDSHALLYRVVDPDLHAPRGAIQALIVPLLAVAAARNTAWALDIGVSRGAVFHSAALVGSGLFLLLMAGAGYYLREFGGNWGPLLQVIFVAAACTLVAIVMTSGRARGQLRVFINKHFFSYKYDYRLEWHRFIDKLAGPSRGGPLCERVIEAVADIMDSPGGAIWLQAPGASSFAPAAAWNFPIGSEVEAAEGEFARYLETSERIVVLPPTGEQAREIVVPEWLAASPEAWLVVPLRHPDGLLGFLVLRRSRAPRSLDWEDWDLLRTVGRQAASYLAEQAAIQAVADARQLEAFNRRFAFVVHDLKNLVGPLAMLLGNAARHGDNPEFREDLLATVADSVARMKRMLTEFGAGQPARRATVPVSIAAVTARVGQAKASPALVVEPPDADLAIVADPDHLEAALGHLVQNALEAVRGIGRVTVRAQGSDTDQVIIEVTDDGPGMSAAFVRDELFRPLSTTKRAGHGIGAFQARELVRDMGGRLDVESAPGAGTTMRLSFPRHRETARMPVLVEAAP
jgi:putative PEP-CTERM system histidine kinase